MNIKELIQELQKYPDDTIVVTPYYDQDGCVDYYTDPEFTKILVVKSVFPEATYDLTNRPSIGIPALLIS